MQTPDLPPEMEARARALHAEAFIYDACVFYTGFLQDEVGEIQALVDGGLNGANVTVCDFKHNFAKGVDTVLQFKRIAQRHAGKVRFCTSVEELERCKKEGVVGLVVFFQDTKPIEDELGYLEVFHSMGLRVLQMTYNVQGFVGAGCCEPNDPGLSVFGKRVVAECNRLGILIDLSHVNHNTSWDAIRLSKAPVAFTHVGVYSLCQAYGRNKPDELLKAVAGTGGVVGIVWLPTFLKRNPETHEVLPAGIEEILDHMEYALHLLGIDHVGIGSDMANYSARTGEVAPGSVMNVFRPLRPDVFGAGPIDRRDPYATGLDSHAKLLNLTRGLVRRGYRDEEIKKLLGGNWLRLFREVWRG